MAEESKRAVFAAMGANFAIAVGKLAAGLVTHSSALLAEAGHSLADTVNQVFVLLGINLSDSKPDAAHPHGYGKESFFWSFLAAIFIFVAGAVFSWFEGTRTLIVDTNHHRTPAELTLAYGVLGMAFLFEATSFVIAVHGIRVGARELGWSFWRYIRHSPDLSIKTVFFEDSAALIGLLIAAGGLTLSELFHTEAWDGIASIAIGFLLAGVALTLGAQARGLLLGAAANREVVDKLYATIRSFPEILGIVRLLTMQIGPHSILVTGDIQVSRDLGLDDAEDLIVRLDHAIARNIPDITEAYWELKPVPGGQIHQGPTLETAVPNAWSPRPERRD